MKETIDDTIKVVKKSITENNSNKHCIRDYSGDVFELTSEMLVKNHFFDKEQSKELASIAECILQKYSKLLSLTM